MDGHNHLADALLDVARVEHDAQLSWMRGGTGAGSQKELTDRALRERLVEALAEVGPLREKLEQIECLERKIVDALDEATVLVLDDLDEDPMDCAVEVRGLIQAIKDSKRGSVSTDVLELLEAVAGYYQDRIRSLKERLEEQREALEAAAAAAEARAHAILPVVTEAAVTPPGSRPKPMKKRGRPRTRPAPGSTTIPLSFDAAPPPAAPDPADPFCHHCPAAYAGNDGLCDRHGLKVPECWNGDQLRKGPWLTGERKWMRPRQDTPAATTTATDAAPEKKRRGRPPGSGRKRAAPKPPEADQ